MVYPLDKSGHRKKLPWSSPSLAAQLQGDGADPRVLLRRPLPHSLEVGLRLSSAMQVVKTSQKCPRAISTCNSHSEVEHMIDGTADIVRRIVRLLGFADPCEPAACYSKAYILIEDVTMSRQQQNLPSVLHVHSKELYPSGSDHPCKQQNRKMSACHPTAVLVNQRLS